LINRHLCKSILINITALFIFELFNKAHEALINKKKIIKIIRLMNNKLTLVNKNM